MPEPLVSVSFLDDVTILHVFAQNYAVGIGTQGNLIVNVLSINQLTIYVETVHAKVVSNKREAVIILLDVYEVDFRWDLLVFKGNGYVLNVMDTFRTQKTAEVYGKTMGK